MKIGCMVVVWIRRIFPGLPPIDNRLESHFTSEEPFLELLRHAEKHAQPGFEEAVVEHWRAAFGRCGMLMYFSSRNNRLLLNIAGRGKTKAQERSAK